MVLDACSLACSCGQLNGVCHVIAGAIYTYDMHAVQLHPSWPLGASCSLGDGAGDGSSLACAHGIGLVEEHSALAFVHVTGLVAYAMH